MRDDRVRQNHRMMEGRVYLAAAPVWQAWRPPNGWNCRCWVEAFTAAEVAERGWAIDTEAPRNLTTGQPAVPDRGWAQDFTRRDWTYDWSMFPADWRRAIGVNEEADDDEA
jgi:hypothetical protein